MTVPEPPEALIAHTTYLPISDLSALLQVTPAQVERYVSYLTAGDKVAWVDSKF